MSVLDFGCGAGQFANFLVSRGLSVTGIEPSAQARERVIVPVFDNLHSLKSDDSELQFDVVTLLNVLEHIREPAGLLSEIKAVMHTDSLLVIRVPNDFSTLQAAARRRLDIDPWWIVYPDHINYFDFTSLSSLLLDSGFRILDKTADFPMEFFLLFGDNYIGNPSQGDECHTRRRSFELALHNEIRRHLYRSLAKQGMGRNCLVVAQLIE